MPKMIPPRDVIMNIPLGRVLTVSTIVIHVVFLYFSEHIASLYVVLFVSFELDLFK
jgi:hypothetical protein